MKLAATVVSIVLLVAPAVSASNQGLESKVSTGFTVNIAYTPKAQAKLKELNDTVIVAAFVSGKAKPSAPKKELSETGEINLAQQKVEVLVGQPAQYFSFDISPKLVKHAAGDDLRLLINVYSAHDSNAANVLNCTTYDAGFFAIQEQTINLSCKLIGE